MPEQPLTPEEKLLRIIESPAQAIRRIGPRRRINDFKFSFKLFASKYGPKVKELLNLKTMNVILVFSSVVATVFLGLDFWIGMPRLTNLARLELVAKNQDIGEMSIGRLDPLTVYLQVITHRNIFALAQPAKETAPVSPQTSEELKSLVDTLKLVGIIWSQAPQAIIEDTKEGRTYLLNRGGKLKNARVKEILKDRVILSYDDQEIELR